MRTAVHKLAGMLRKHRDRTDAGVGPIRSFNVACSPLSQFWIACLRPMESEIGSRREPRMERRNGTEYIDLIREDASVSIRDPARRGPSRPLCRLPLRFRFRSSRLPSTTQSCSTSVPFACPLLFV